MKTILFFDIDATLTPPRQPITKEMAKALIKLSVPFAVAAGSNMDLVREQFFLPLFEHGYRGIFDAYIGNGTMHYHCDYRKKPNIKLVSSFNIREYLGEQDYQKILSTLKEVLIKKEFALPPEITVSEEKITDRTSMINFITFGRVKTEGPEGQANRRRFAEFDKTTNYRLRIIDFLNKKLEQIIKKKGLRILLGGQTSFDIIIDGYDKTYPLRKLVPSLFEKAIFIGDALFPGGNDYVVQEFIDKWNSPNPCPYEAIKTENWKNTIEILRGRGFLTP